MISAEEADRLLSAIEGDDDIPAAEPVDESIPDEPLPGGAASEAAIAIRRGWTGTTTAKKRIALLLHAVLGYSVKEVAAMTESGVSTTKSRTAGISPSD